MRRRLQQFEFNHTFSLHLRIWIRLRLNPIDNNSLCLIIVRLGHYLYHHREQFIRCKYYLYSASGFNTDNSLYQPDKCWIYNNFPYGLDS